MWFDTLLATDYWKEMTLKISWKHVNNTWNISVRVAVVKCGAARAVEGLWTSALIHTSSCRVIHDNIKQMEKCDVACSWLEPSLLRVHTDIKWSDGPSAVETSAVFSHSRWLWTAIPQEYQVLLMWLMRKQLTHVDMLIYITHTVGNKLYSITVWALWCIRAEDFFGVFFFVFPDRFVWVSSQPISLLTPNNRHIQ